VGDDRVCIGHTRPDVVRFEAGIVGENLLRRLSLASRLRISSTEILIPRTMGLPPKMSRSAVMRARSLGSIMSASRRSILPVPLRKGQAAARETPLRVRS